MQAFARAIIALFPPEDIVKMILTVILLPILFLSLFLVGPTLILMKIPLAGPVELKYYQDAAEKINREMQDVEEPPWTSLDWRKLVAVDAVLFQQRFNLASPERAQWLAEKFTRIVEEKRTEKRWDSEKQEYVTKTVVVQRYVTFDEVLQELGIYDKKQMVENYLSVDLSLLANVDEGIDTEGDFSPVEGNFTWPLPGYYRVSSKFGPRIHPVTGKNSFHRGIDLPAPRGTKIVAAKDGIVVGTSYSPVEGKTVVIKHDFGFTRYAHMDSFAVTRGQKVKAGEKIGEVGSTGFFSTGAHLHFEVRPDNKPADPLQFFR
ncbi:M23 family metallopeptidase [Zhaonella formicivorans]|uniref:M23 family metallopeptidase n=1 Tax=Zhaonella formicivorans TaxID=2528593 RepID=UPI0010EF28DA|nr:M23 family metallopeptidase [Zhaonella formicivorans]